MSHSGTLVCLACQMPGPPPEMTCTLGRDHRVGVAADPKLAMIMVFGLRAF